ncbi:MAG: RNA methyltransferase [Thermodesulfobacteriota bacterium]
MAGTLRLDNIGVILVEPQIPENIGAAARAMSNMGLQRLSLVRPKNCDLSRILKTATGPSMDVIENMDVFDEFLPAIGAYGYVIGTTARLGANRPAFTNPHELAAQLISITQKNLAALVFGPEDRGLSNEHLRYCHSIATIPTAGFSSLNLAQGVMVFCYEIFLAGRKHETKSTPRLADKFELEGMYGHLRDVLEKIGFLNPQNPEHWMLIIRRFLSRMPLQSREVRVIRGICRQLDWYTGQIEKRQGRDRAK